MRDVADFFLCGSGDEACLPVCGTATAERDRFTLTVRQPGDDQAVVLSFPADAPVSEVFRALTERMA